MKNQMKNQMKKGPWALATVLALGGFATASANMSVGLEPRSKLMHWATVVFCDQDDDGRTDQHEICVEGHTGGVAGGLVEQTLNAVPGISVATTFVGL